jgi:hypothetical protein
MKFISIKHVTQVTVKGYVYEMLLFTSHYQRQMGSQVIQILRHRHFKNKIEQFLQSTKAVDERFFDSFCFNAGTKSLKSRKHVKSVKLCVYFPGF